jgi:hypothetical protein
MLQLNSLYEWFTHQEKELISDSKDAKTDGRSI